MKRLLRGAIVASLLALSTGALADPASADTRARAKEAYDRGVAAHARGDMEEAAHEFARADSISPSPVALQAALDAAIVADDPALGSELLDRSGKRGAASGPLAASVRAAKKRFAGRAGRVRVACPATDCRATLDGSPIQTNEPTWARIGQHDVVLSTNGNAQSNVVRVEPDRIVEVSPRPVEASETGEAPPPTAPAFDSSTDGHRHPTKLPPIYFYAGAGATVLLAGATAYFGLDAKNKHDEFENVGCARTNLSSCQGLKDDGESAQTAANVSLALTGIVGVATAVVGIAFTDWHGPLVAAVPGGAAVAFARRF